MKILSWNMKSYINVFNFPSYDEARVARALIDDHDLVIILEARQSPAGNKATKNLTDKLLNTPSRTYGGFIQRTGFTQTQEDDSILVLGKLATITVKNTTDQRVSAVQTYLARLPVYFNVTENSSGKTLEFCAWHAPEPMQTDAILKIWSAMCNNTIITADEFERDPTTGKSTGKKRRVSMKKTALIAGDFNHSALPLATVGNIKDFKRKIDDVTTINAIEKRPDLSSTGYRSGGGTGSDGKYDHFFVDETLVSVTSSAVIDVIAKLVTDGDPLKSALKQRGRPATTFDAYAFYKRISDHLPVAVELTFS
jgi:endonuclease/exonuclease/phosphatase family metal-dependent hydrolase